jgi:hypothetical protein
MNEQSRIGRVYKILQKINPIIIFCIIGFFVYGNALINKLVWEDYITIVRNPYIHEWSHVSQYFTEDYSAGAGLSSGYYRPMQLMVDSLGWHIWGEWPSGYHMVSVLLHITNVCLLYYLLLLLFKNKFLAFFTACVFLVHPALTEAVAYVNDVNDLLGACGMFLAIILFLGFYRSNGKARLVLYGGSIASFIFALLSRETTLVLPLLLVPISFFANTEGRFLEKLKKIVFTVVPFFITALFYFIARFYFLNFNNYISNGLGGNKNLSLAIFLFFKKITFYIGLFLYPNHLHMERTVSPVAGIDNVPTVIGILFTLLSIAVVTKYYKKHPQVVFALCWFYITYFAVCNFIFPLNYYIYEHWLYLPVIGLGFLSGCALEWLWQFFIARKIPWGKGIVAAIVVAYFIFFVAATIRANRVWKNNIRVYGNVLTYDPKNYRALLNMGSEYAEEGNVQDAARFYEQAVVAEPANPTAYIQLGQLFQNNHRLPEAADQFRKSLALDPRLDYPFYHLLQILLQEPDVQAINRAVLDRLEYSQSREESIEVFLKAASLAQLEHNSVFAQSWSRSALALDPNNVELKASLKLFLNE